MELTEEELILKLKQTKSGQEIREWLDQIPIDYFTSLKEKGTKLSQKSATAQPTDKTWHEIRQEHISEVHQWLEQNVKVYTTPKVVTLSAFEIDWEKLSGTFEVSFDNEPLEQRMYFYLEPSGKVAYAKPMFVSPLGAPASYAAIELTKETEEAILKGLHETIPSVKECGTDHDTGEEIQSSTPLSKRIKNNKEFDAARNRASSKDYVVCIETVSTF